MHKFGTLLDSCMNQHVCATDSLNLPNHIKRYALYSVIFNFLCIHKCNKGIFWVRENIWKFHLKFLWKNFIKLHRIFSCWGVIFSWAKSAVYIGLQIRLIHVDPDLSDAWQIIWKVDPAGVLLMESMHEWIGMERLWWISFDFNRIPDNSWLFT